MTQIEFLVSKAECPKSKRTYGAPCDLLNKFCYHGNIIFDFFQLLEKGRLSGGCGLRWAGTRIDKWESSCRRTTRIIPTLRVVLQYPSTPGTLSTPVAGYSWAGGEGGVGEMETEIDRHSFGHLHHSSLASILNFILSKVSISMNFYSSSKLRGILTLSLVLRGVIWQSGILNRFLGQLPAC